MITKTQKAQLKQLNKAGDGGIWSSDLNDRPTTRELIKAGFAENSAGDKADLRQIYITNAGIIALKEAGR